MIRTVFAFLAGIMLALVPMGGIYLWLLVPGLAFLLTALVWKSQVDPTGESQYQEIREKPDFMGQEEEDFASSGNAFDHKNRMKYWDAADRDLDEAMDHLFALCAAHFEQADHIFVYFKSSDEGSYLLRRFYSRIEEERSQINAQAQIQVDTAHVFGILLKRQASYVIEGDLSAFAPLPHYASDLGQHSCVAVPLLFGDTLRGLICLDSKQKGAFNATDVEFLAHISELLAHTAFLGYQGISDRLHGLTAQTLLDFERQLLQCESIQEIQRYLARAIDRHLPYDRLLFLEPDPERPGEGRVILAAGIDAEGYQDMHMKLEGRGLLSLVFQNGNLLHRRFRKGEIVYRLTPEEPCSVEMSCMLAVPVSSKEGKVQLVVAIESYQQEDYAPSQRELFKDMALATGFALVKAQDLESQKRLANQDGLTKLINHRHFHELHQQMHQQSRQENRPYAMLLCGIDSFKNINEKFGHATGDEVLQAVAALLYGLMDVDQLVLARYGGDEFAVLLPDCGEKWAIHLGQEICREIAGASIPLQPNVTREGEAFVRIGISVGCSVFQAREGKSKQDMISEASQALQVAKRPDEKGRRHSQVVVYR